MQSTNFDKATWRTLMQRICDVSHIGRIKKNMKHDDLINAAYSLDSRLIGKSTVDDIRMMPRRDNYLGNTVNNYWE